MCCVDERRDDVRGLSLSGGADKQLSQMNNMGTDFEEVEKAVLAEGELDETLSPTELLVKTRYSGISSGGKHREIKLGVRG